MELPIATAQMMQSRARPSVRTLQLIPNSNPRKQPRDIELFEFWAVKLVWDLEIPI
jgi:hypothetical protein